MHAVLAELTVHEELYDLHADLDNPTPVTFKQSVLGVVIAIHALEYQ